MLGLREPYQYLMGLLYMLYGLKDCSIFRDSWIPLSYDVANYGWTFKWGAILSSTITRALERTKENNTELALSFLMSAYLLDYVCASLEFLGMNWEKNNNLPISEIFQHLWLNKYKSSYSIIYDFCWAPLSEFFYGKECPRLYEDA
jgi:hypothetical protein